MKAKITFPICVLLTAITCIGISSFTHREYAKKGLKDPGVALYSFSHFPYEVTLKKTDSVGCNYVEGVEWLNMGEHFGKKTLGNLNAEELIKAKKILDSFHFTMPSIYVATGGGVTAWKHRFEMGKAMGAKRLVCEPEKNELNMIDSLANIYNMYIALHEHEKGHSRYWHPDSVLAAIKGHNRIGACADIGHWKRSGLDVVECLKILKGHILELHVKNIDKDKNDVNLQDGIIDYPAVLKELQQQHFKDDLIIEYEHNFENNVEGIKNEIIWLKGLMKKNN